MKTNQFDIVIELRLRDNDYVRSKFLLQAFDDLETALYASDRKDVEQAASSLDITNVVKDASLERLRQHKNNRLLLTEAKTGSIEIFALVAGVSYYILDKTLGETLKDSYVNSYLHKELKEFFRRKIDEKALSIVENIRRAFASKKKEVSVRLLPPAPGQPNTIVIELTPDEKTKVLDRIKSLGDELDNER